MSRRKLIVALLGAALAIAAVVSLRSSVQPPGPRVVGPDGQVISAYQDSRLVSGLHRPSTPPPPPGSLHTDQRRGGVLVSWPPAAPGLGFEVRWGPPGRAGNELNDVRYVATPSTSLRGLAPGRYRVEVRAVDEIGQRSAPSSTEVDVADDAPPWQQGLGFVDDFERSEGLDPTRWHVSDGERRCLGREPGALLLTDCGYTNLRLASPLTLGEADADGVRGRVVVVTDAPAQLRRRPPDEPKDVEYGPPDGLTITLSSVESGPPAWGVMGVTPGRTPGSVVSSPALPAEAIDVHLSTRGVLFTVGEGLPVPAPAEHSLPPSAMVSPGALHRWEVRILDGRVEVHRDGLAVTSVELRPRWREATVALSTYGMTEHSVSGSRPSVRIGAVGLTGPAPDPTAVRVLDLSDVTDHGSSFTLPVPALPNASAARLTGGVTSATMEDRIGSRPAPIGEMNLDVDGRRIPLRRSGGADLHVDFSFVADVPVRALARESKLTLSSPTGAQFVAFEVALEVRYPAGARIDVAQPVLREPVPEPTAADLVVTQDGRELGGDDLVSRGTVDVEIRPDAGAAQSVGGSLVGWVALRVELGGRRILDYPTSTAGPAFAGSYRFTLNTSDLPAGTPSTLAVTLVPDRSGRHPVRTSLALRVQD